MKNKSRIISTTYAPLQPPYQVIMYDREVAIQIGTLIVTVERNDVGNEYGIETHSHPVVTYEDKNRPEFENMELTSRRFLEGAVWNNVEVKEVTTVCLAGATLKWQDFMSILKSECLLSCYRKKPNSALYLHLIKLGIDILPPNEQECTIDLDLCIQPEESGLSLQSQESSPIFLNVSAAEDGPSMDNVFYRRDVEFWDAHEWKSEESIKADLMTQLELYKYVLADVLFYNPKGKRFLRVKYITHNEHFKKIVEELNSSDKYTKFGPES